MAATMDPAMAIEAAALAKQQPMLAALAKGDSEVQRFYKNSVIFITGGSGFLGKQLIAKLLRACLVPKIFVLLRPKKEKDIQSRLREILRDPIFDTLREDNPNFLTKIYAISGDVSEIRLGIKDDDWEMLANEVDVIFHVAATTRFDEPLRTATLINIRGTREALLLGRACKKLRSYVHVSTAYTNATTTLIGKTIKEDFYGAPVPPSAMISMAEKMESDRLMNITTSLIKDWPNTYTFTKSIAEELVREMSVDLPICIVKPGVVISTYRDTPGWLDMSCVYGASGLVLGIGLGVIHVAYLNREPSIGIIPCDYVNNCIIVAAKETAINQAKGGNKTRIYSVASTMRNPIFSGDLCTILDNKARIVETPKSIYYVFAIKTASKYIFMILSVFLHFIPAYIADLACTIMGTRRRFSKLAHKGHKMSKILTYFLSNEWEFSDNNTNELYRSLTEQDQAIFNFDSTNIDWTECLLIWCIGIRKYLIKDGLKDTEYAIRRGKYFRVFHYVLMSLYIYTIYKLVSVVYFCFNQLLLTYLKYTN